MDGAGGFYGNPEPHGGGPTGKKGAHVANVYRRTHHPSGLRDKGGADDVHEPAFEALGECDILRNV